MKVSLRDGVSRDRMMSVHDPEIAMGKEQQGGSTDSRRRLWWTPTLS